MPRLTRESAKLPGDRQEKALEMRRLRLASERAGEVGAALPRKLAQNGAYSAPLLHTCGWNALSRSVGERRAAPKCPRLPASGASGSARGRLCAGSARLAWSG